MTETPEVQPPGANVPGYLLPLNILATLFCCLPVGILGIIFSVQARSNSQAGNYAAASAAVRRANISLIISVVLGILLITLVLVFGILGSIVALVSGGAGRDVSGDEDFALEDAVPKYVGDFRLQEVKDFPEGIQLGAEEALTATYKKPGSPQLTHNLLDMPSPDEANKLRQQQVQKQLGESGLRVTSEEPVEDDDGNKLGMATVLEGKTRGSTGTAVLWTDEDLYCEAITEGDDAEAFYEDADC